MFLRRVMILQADSHDVTLVKNIGSGLSDRERNHSSVTVSDVTLHYDSHSIVVLC